MGMFEFPDVFVIARHKVPKQSKRKRGRLLLEIAALHSQ